MSITTDSAMNDSVELHDPRQGHAYIDEADDPALLEWSEHSDAEDTEEDLEEYDDQRIEDEDWEIAERGEKLFTPLSLIKF
jgi:RIO kinase 1